MSSWDELSKRQRRYHAVFKGSGLVGIFALVAQMIVPVAPVAPVVMIACGALMAVFGKMHNIACDNKDRLLSPAEIAQLKEVIYEAQLGLNKLMRQKHAAYSDEIYSMANELQELLNELRDKLNETGDLKRDDFITQIEALRKALEDADNVARKELKQAARPVKNVVDRALGLVTLRKKR